MRVPEPTKNEVETEKTRRRPEFQLAGHFGPRRLAVSMDSPAFREPRQSQERWLGRCNSYCTTREALARTIRERCGKVHPEAIAILKALPATIPNAKIE